MANGKEWRETHYTITIQRDEEGRIFDVNIYDGYYSISTDDLRRVAEVIEELEN